MKSCGGMSHTVARARLLVPRGRLGEHFGEEQRERDEPVNELAVVRHGYGVAPVVDRAGVESNTRPAPTSCQKCVERLQRAALAVLDLDRQLSYRVVP